MIRTLLIDDEEHCLATLRWHLDTYCPQVQIVGSCFSGAEGLTGIYTHQPDLVFLDIELITTSVLSTRSGSVP
ncbi:LytR/AlgR family response regulator transcription factor [Nibrella viscosa]|uniref:LytR/AlgR family response regulator transcription factor n=1 Tax=Nibrella viscosa TaxID=1084524 RepID=UPI0031F1164B